MKAKTQGGGSTAAVLWLMILLVFLPIATAHGIALLFEGSGEMGAGAKAE